jgi:hypothetical protein
MNKFIPVLAAVSLIVAGCDLSHQDAEDKFAADVDEHGVPMSKVIGPDDSLGDAVCKDMQKGTSPYDAVVAVSNNQVTLPQAMVIVYWAVKDLCTDQDGPGVHEFWRDDVNNPPPEPPPPPDDAPPPADSQGG